VDEAAEEVAPLDARQSRDRVASGHGGCGRIGGLKVEGAVRPPAVVVAHVDAQDTLELAAADDEQPV
jgi:hypothetical protein